MAGFQLMKTKNMRKKLIEENDAASQSQIEGVSGRWTFFTQLFKENEPEPNLASTVFAIDSAQEILTGIGRLFDSKKVIGER